MKSLYPLLALAALAACNQNSSPAAVENTAAANTAAAEPVVLPPAIRSQKTYRCKDQSLVYVTWFVGDKTANVRDEQNGPVTVLESPTGGSPWTSAVGWTLAGDDENIRVTNPDKGIRDCHA